MDSALEQYTAVWRTKLDETDLCDITATDLRAAIRRKAVLPVEVTADFEEAVPMQDRRLPAFSQN